VAGIGVATGWTAEQTRAQYGAIAWLRWRILVNQFKKKGGAGELIGSIVTYLIFAGFAFGMMALAGSMSFLAANSGHLGRVNLVLWGVFAICQLTNIQMGQPGTVFDPTQLIRFPMRVGNYVAIRLFFGLLSPANIIGGLLSFAVAVGVVMAVPSLWFYALVGLTVFAIVNALFSRMLFAWVDRWLSTRRAREIFTAFIFAGSLGIQWANFTFNPAYHHHRGSNVSMERITNTVNFYHRAQPFIRPLPPGLIGSALVSANQGHVVGFLGFTLGCAAYGALFFAIFAWRTSVEFRGENFSDAANGVSAKAKPVAVVAPVVVAAPQPVGPSVLPSAVAAVMGKEFLHVRRNTGIFYGLVAPVVFVFLFAGKIATRGNAAWIFPAALAYALMGIAPLSFNSFGLEGAGVQFYFMAPVRLRDVFLAKNLVSFALALLEIAAVFAIISYVAVPPSLTMLGVALLWAAATLLLTTTLGNRRSVTAPKKIELGRAASKQASSLSALISLGTLVGSAAVGGGLLILAIYLHALWMLLPVFLAFAGGALWFYRLGLGTIDQYALDNREALFEELCKK
jgi:ABC-2 type transport system permease protein